MFTSLISTIKEMWAAPRLIAEQHAWIDYTLGTTRLERGYLTYAEWAAGMEERHAERRELDDGSFREALHKANIESFLLGSDKEQQRNLEEFRTKLDDIHSKYYQSLRKRLAVKQEHLDRLMVISFPACARVAHTEAPSTPAKNTRSATKFKEDVVGGKRRRAVVTEFE